MFSTLLSTLNSLIYTLLAFCVPLYFTVKSLLRQFTVSIVPSANINMDGNDDSEVPATFIESKPIFKTESLSSNSFMTTGNGSSSSSAWLYYWAILAVIHCFTGLYERTLLPIFGNSFLYYCAKFFALHWLSRDEAQASRSLWTAFLAPFAVKYEKDVDRFVQNCREQGRLMVTKSVASLREISIKNFKISSGAVKVPIKMD